LSSAFWILLTKSQLYSRKHWLKRINKKLILFSPHSKKIKITSKKIEDIEFCNRDNFQEKYQRNWFSSIFSQFISTKMFAIICATLRLKRVVHDFVAILARSLMAFFLPGKMFTKLTILLFFLKLAKILNFYKDSDFWW